MRCLKVHTKQYKGIRFIGRKQVNLKKHYIGYKRVCFYDSIPETNTNLIKKGYKIKGWIYFRSKDYEADDIESERFVPVFYRRKKK